MYSVRGLLIWLTMIVFASIAPAMAQAPNKPNILVIMSDDVGTTNVSAYSRGLAGYQTPNIDRIANEGMIFTDYYAEQSCTAGRSAFITGQSPGTHGADQGGISRCRNWNPAGRPNTGRAAEEPRLCNRSVRQESLW